MAARGSSTRAKKEPEIRLLTADEVLAADDLPEKTVAVPEWGAGVGVKIRALSKKQQDDVRKRSTVRGVVDEGLAEIHAIMESLVEPKFTVDQLEELRGKSAAAIDRISQEIMAMNGLTAEALQAIEALFREAS